MTRADLALPWDIERSSDGRTAHICDALGRRLFKVLPAGEAVADAVLEAVEDPHRHNIERLEDYIFEGEV
ncbi:MAG: hypothetical protein ABTQ30_15140 [Rhizobiaceae bacterium]